MAVPAKGVYHRKEGCDMNKQAIVRRFERETRGQAFITATQLTKLLGQKNSYRVKQNFLDGLEAINGTLYFIPDVAESLMRKIGE